MRIIIVGAGPVGLMFAHTLLRAGITDFLLLERSSDVVKPSGAGLGLWPQNVRVFDQLGLLDEASKLAPRMRRSLHLSPNGSLLSTSDLFYMFERKCVDPISWLLDRHSALTQLLTVTAIHLCYSSA